MQKKFIITMLAVGAAATVSAQAFSLADIQPQTVQTPTSYAQILEQLQAYLGGYTAPSLKPTKPESSAPNLKPDTSKPDVAPEVEPEIEPEVEPDTTPDVAPEADTAPDAALPDPAPDTSTPSVPDSSTPEADQSMAQQILALVNQERAAAGLSALVLDGSVTQAATVRAGELQSSFSHTRPDGSSCFTALQQAGVSYRGAGENIAYGQSTAQAVMTAWMNSSGHRANILSESFTTLGVGYTVVNGTPYWVQMFTY